MLLSTVRDVVSLVISDVLCYRIFFFLVLNTFFLDLVVNDTTHFLDVVVNDTSVTSVISLEESLTFQAALFLSRQSRPPRLELTGLSLHSTASACPATTNATSYITNTANQTFHTYLQIGSDWSQMGLI